MLDLLQIIACTCLFVFAVKFSFLFLFAFSGLIFGKVTDTQGALSHVLAESLQRSGHSCYAFWGVSHKTPS